jgi:hypothetical protein
MMCIFLTVITCIFSIQPAKIKTIEMPDAREILGDLAGPRDKWPAFDSTPDDGGRALYLRETEAYEDLMFHFTKVLVMNDFYRQKATKKGLSLYMGVSLESFLVLTYVNNYETWYKDCKGELPRRPICFETGSTESETSGVSGVSDNSTQKFTAASRGKGKYRGWSDTGMDLFNHLGDLLAFQRANPHGDDTLADFENNLLDRFKGVAKQPTTAPAQGPRNRNMDLLTVYSDDED